MSARSAGVYTFEEDRSFGVAAIGDSVGGIVINSDRGPLGVTRITSRSKFLDRYGEPTSDTLSKFSVIHFLRDAPAINVKRVIVDAVAASVDVMDTQATPAVTFTVNAENPGAWGNDISVSFAEVASDSELFDMFVYEDGTQVESFRVSKNSDKKDGFGATVYIEDVVNNRSIYVRVEDDTSTSELPAFDTTYDLVDGSDDTTPVSSSEVVLGWDDFMNIDEVDVNILINGGFADETVQNKMIAVAEHRKDCVAILDVPQSDSLSATDMVDYRNTTLNANTSWAALYGPWINFYDSFSDRTVTVPPSGYAGGVIARTSEVAEVWDAPAGLRRGILNVSGVNNILDQADRDFIYENGINPIASFSGQGTVVWGQKTLLAQASSLDRMNVRRLFIHIQESLRPALQPFVFQPNTEFERNNVNSLITSFMEDIKIRGGVYDHAVNNDESINTPEVIDRNEMLVELFVKPTKTAEVIKLTIINTPTGTDFQ